MPETSMVDYERIGLSLAEMLDAGYTHTWISYLMDVCGVPKEFARPQEGSKYLFCKGLFTALASDPIRGQPAIAEIARYVLMTERFDKNLREEGERVLPWFKVTARKAGLVLPEERGMRVNPVFERRDFQPQRTLCFVLMPFRESWSERIYQKVLKPVLAECQVAPKRADDLFGSRIMEDIWAGINSAFIVLADVTNRNPNVFYELGIAHTVGKNVVLMTQQDDDVPFDIKPYRYIKYEDNQDGYEFLRKMLPEFIAHIREGHRQTG
jgi:hypothetical protein